MAITILPQATSNMGEFAQGLSQGMQALAHMKMQEYAQNQQATKNEQFFNSLPGMTPEKAKAYANASPEMQQLGLKQLLQAQDPSRMAFAKGVASLAQPGSSGQQQGFDELLGQMNPRDALALMTYRQAQSNKEVDQQLKQQKAAQEQEKQFAAEDARLQPYLDKEKQQLDNLKNAADLAKTMQGIVKAKYHKFPGFWTRNAPTAIQDLMVSDPDVSRYLSGLNEMPLLLAQTRKGMPSNYKIKMEQLAKARAGQPAKAQLELLQEPITRYEEELARANYRESLRDKKSGRLPTDIESRMSRYDVAEAKPLQYPDMYKKDTVIEEDGKRYRRIVKKDGTPDWKEL